MAKFLKKPSDEFDRDLAAKGLKRAQYLANVIATDTGKKDDEGNPIYSFGHVYREKIVPICDDKLVKKGKPRMNVESSVKKSTRGNAVYTFKKAPREGSKLAIAVTVVTETGKDDKPACITAIVDKLGVTAGNASIYYQKAKSLIEAGF